MFGNNDLAGKCVSGLVAALTLSISGHDAHAGFKAIYSFTGGSDGADVYAGLIGDAAGNLYGTTYDSASGGYGTVFKLSGHRLTVLHAFVGTDGANPYARLIMDSAGNLYGTTEQGGSSGLGTVFEVAADATETVLHSFAGKGDGSFPKGGLIMDAAGNIYGTTTVASGYNAGTVFKLAPNGTATVLYAFTGGSDGGYPYDGVIEDKAGNFYGTTESGGMAGRGTVFRLAPDGTETVLHSFGSGHDGASPEGDLIIDKAGNLYGTTSGGGNHGNGTVFTIGRDGKETVLYAFAGGSDGANPYGAVLRDKSGDLYGTTSGGGLRKCYAGSRCGTVFKLAPNGLETVLYAFTNGSDGANPYAGLTDGPEGDLYGTALGGGSSGYGTIFKLRR